MASYKTKLKNESVSLTSQHYLTEGGEGQIFVKNDIAYKIYFPGKEPPEGKLDELRKINNKNVIVPIDILLDTKTNKYVGNSMRFLNQNNYLSTAQIISNNFWANNKVTHNSISCLINHFQNTINDIHKCKTLLVDINEFNFLTDSQLKEIYCIDTNSYQTESYPATAIMEANRDWQNLKFTELTDWFSFAILSFYIYSGIHPFKSGNYPGLTGSLDEVAKHRILNNISVLNSKVKYPSRAVRDFKLIPKNWFDWYYSEFEKGERNSPPNNFNQVSPITQQHYQISSDCLLLKDIQDFDEEIVRLDKIGGQRLVITDNYVYLDSSRYNRNSDKFIIHENRLMNVKIKNNRLDINGFQSTFECTDLFISNNTIYTKSSGKLCKILLKNNLILMSIVASISELTAKCYGYQDGFMIENLAGETYLILANNDSSYQIKIPELVKHSIISAEKSGNYIIGYSRKNNEYYNFKIKLENFLVESCDLLKVSGMFDLEFIHHKNGVLIELLNDKLVLTNNNKHKIVNDKFFNQNSIHFVEVNGEMYFSNNKKLFIGKLK